MGKKTSLQKMCKLVRSDVLNISYNANIGHIGSSFSIIEILVALYFKTLNIHPKEPAWEKRDRFILSKGHAAAALFSTLYRKGFFSEKVLNTFCKDGGKLAVHPEWNGLPGIEHSTGSLGHGLPVGVGMAYAAKLLDKKHRVFVLLSDSEIDEGSTWEATLFAAHHKLDNLTIVLDYNGTQAMGKVSEILNIEPIENKWKAFNFETKVVDGHDLEQLTKALAPSKNRKVKAPKIVIAKTIMGKGISFMENDFEWHYYNLKNEQFEKAMKELNIQ